MPLGAFWGAFGCLWGAFGCLGAALGGQGSSQGVLGRKSRGRQGGFRVRFGVILGPEGAIVKQNGTRQDKTRQEKTRKDKTRQGRTRKDKKRQEIGSLRVSKSKEIMRRVVNFKSALE